MVLSGYLYVIPTGCAAQPGHISPENKQHTRRFNSAVNQLAVEVAELQPLMAQVVQAYSETDEVKKEREDREARDALAKARNLQRLGLHSAELLDAELESSLRQIDRQIEPRLKRLDEKSLSIEAFCKTIKRSRAQEEV